MKDLSLASNATYIEEQYHRWHANPQSVPEDWRWFFEGFSLGVASEVAPSVEAVAGPEDIHRHIRVAELIRRYRELGHLLSCVDPLEPCALEHPLLTLEACGLEAADLDRVFFTPEIAFWDKALLRDVVALMKETYAGSVGVEFMHLTDAEERRWLQERMESTRNHPPFSTEERLHILKKLWQANRFEQFLHKTYLGQKRFSLEGAETVVPMLDGLIRHAAVQGCETLVLGMAHRGRLNVQVNVLGKSPAAVFSEFEESCDTESETGSGDVKYHKGFTGWVSVSEDGLKKVRTLLLPNPSHLESVNPVVEGLARALQDALDHRGTDRVLPVLIHGDAAFAGQGVVYETLNLSQLAGYRTGGTLHLVINNQIGFTTVPQEARSTRYATDVAKMLPAPVFHVHGEDPEAAVHVMQLACDYRYRYGKDVVIDVVCYRRYGHNEGDEPYYTQPTMVERIRRRPPVNELYAARLQEAKVVSADQIEELEKNTLAGLENALKEARATGCVLAEDFGLEAWKRAATKEKSYAEGVPTAVSAERLLAIARATHTYPAGFHVNPKLEKILDKRREKVESGKDLDWSTGELLALGSLLLEGHPVRLSGQDCGRGTFSHRHAILYDVQSEETYVPLNHLAATQAPFVVVNSSLSEYAVLGFEYGYSLRDPSTLVLWEAQFGDFANNAQTIIDQYVCAAEAKWNVSSGLVLLLPHGYEGMGPEHSSARLERYLQLSAQNNVRVCQPTTPAQFFHLVRRQALHPHKKPLVVMTPKSLLRHPQAVSPLSDFVGGRFESVLDDPHAPPLPTYGILCTGKVYYDLAAFREKAQRDDVVLLRLEEIYPFPEEKLSALLGAYGSVRRWVWAQEEPQNMGAWSFVCPLLHKLLGEKPTYAGRPASASPATGFHRRHKEEQERLVAEAFQDS
ncbi:2-oxoglutarate dehydrogenase E1 component [Desulfosoma caldarium]|uniref:oxoglutarate dehydrogenase (succinyl-transferring) n=1 Tax=Desulfosoma caldarium TaxID=610254 RepID=A0A3N1URD2_9BACT|nr:2-oxoglutarate dehydrogenase E1 component [Desulfosoma caldarium]ROQ89606.1 2-oxoglutarate dehydrogenase E1 component [Desulfosoma caldarium]